MKCTRSRYLNITSTPSKIGSQIGDYYTLCYYDMSEKENIRLERSAISKVIVTYPKQTKSASCDNIGIDVKFIQIEPNGDNIYDHHGYQEIKYEIEEAIKKEVN